VDIWVRIALGALEKNAMILQEQVPRDCISTGRINGNKKVVLPDGFALHQNGAPIY
jgi:hypothetical protein